ncbi:MAG TPA: TAT-variant-translocated molybdopterin oxidoreductase [Gammaproteobacteria bacterium]|nr:TAT-variant-translocated molybdopterin oxidoreductase [Gammaproteobacteria bacterium]
MSVTDKSSGNIPGSINLATIRKKLAGTRGREYWKGLEQVAETPEFDEFLHAEFPRLAAMWDRKIDRRTLLKLMGGSVAFAAAGLAGCSRPIGVIVPYVNMPEGEIPGKPMYFATSLTLGGHARGVIAESYTGRPTFVEGNQEHPASLGAIDSYAQASVEQLYDPDRAQVATYRTIPGTWSAFIEQMGFQAAKMKASGGDGFAILTQSITSPSLLAEIRQVQKRFPKARWYRYQPVGREGVDAGAKLAFGERVNTVYHFDKADVIVSLDADFLGLMPGHLAYARQFADGRRQKPGKPIKMNRLYVIAGTPTITGASADHVLPVPSAKIDAVARSLAARLGIGAAGGTTEAQAHWLDAVVEDLKKHYGRAVVVPGDVQPPAVHALAHAINARLGAVGGTVTYTEPLEPDGAGSLKDLTDAIDHNEINRLLVLGGNPVYDAPADLDFAGHYARVEERIYWSHYPNETAYMSYWHVPAAHELESWGDALAYDGTVSLTQPLIAPLYHGHSAYEVLRVVSGANADTDYDVVRGYWRQHYRRYASNGEAFDAFWKRSVQRGLIDNSALPAKTPHLRDDLASRLPQPLFRQRRGLYLQFRPDDSIFDGRFANSAWLQELPRRLTKITWDNVVMLSPRTAERLGIDNKELVVLGYHGREVTGPAWIMPGQPDNAVTVQLGYGRKRAGRLGTGVGFDVYPLRRADAMWFDDGLTLMKTGKRVFLATTQYHQTMEGRGLLRTATLDHFRDHPHWVDEGYPGKPPKLHESLYPEPAEKPPLEYRWAMNIDLSTCIGCEACVIACQAENNIQSVGKEEVLAGHEMHWLRIDRYYSGNMEDPETYFQPVPCMQCENAPCEYVCPVEASVHAEGLNAQVYNRCIGTRDCSQNCPYKVRRFNWFRYQTGRPTSTPVAAENPDVSVRQRGIMEKCTYCIQRINEAKIAADKTDRRIPDGMVETACQRACPTQAISFGDLNTSHSKINQVKDSPLDYEMLAEINTRPRTSYLGGLTNPNPALAKKDKNA